MYGAATNEGGATGFGPDKNKNKTASAPAGAGSAALSSGSASGAHGHGPGPRTSIADIRSGTAARAAQVGYDGGETSGNGGGGDEAPTITRVGKPQLFTVSQPGSVPISGDSTGKGLTDDSGIITHKHFSPGQLYSALGLAGSVLAGGPLGMAQFGAGLATMDPFSRTPGGVALNDSVGGVPDIGYTGKNHIADNSNRRGDASLASRGSAAAQAALTGNAPANGAGGAGNNIDDGGDELSAVKLKDRRRPYDEMGAVDLLKGLI